MTILISKGTIGQLRDFFVGLKTITPEQIKEVIDMVTQNGLENKISLISFPGHQDHQACHIELPTTTDPEPIPNGMIYIKNTVNQELIFSEVSCIVPLIYGMNDLFKRPISLELAFMIFSEINLQKMQPSSPQPLLPSVPHESPPSSPHHFFNRDQVNYSSSHKNEVNLDEAISRFDTYTVNSMPVDEMRKLITDQSLNRALMTGYHPFVRAALEAGAKPNDDTLLCALFSGQPHYVVSKLIGMGANAKQALPHVEFSSMHHPIRSQLKGSRVNNPGMAPGVALDYAKKNLSEIVEKYGPLRGLQAEAKAEAEAEAEADRRYNYRR